MKNKVFVIVIIFILFVVGLSGCSEETTSDFEGVWYVDEIQGKWTFFDNETLIQDYGEHGKFIYKWEMDSKYIIIYDDFTTKFSYEFSSDKKILLLESSEYGNLTLRR